MTTHSLCIFTTAAVSGSAFRFLPTTITPLSKRSGNLGSALFLFSSTFSSFLFLNLISYQLNMKRLAY